MSFSEQFTVGPANYPFGTADFSAVYIAAPNQLRYAFTSDQAAQAFMTKLGNWKKSQALQTSFLLFYGQIPFIQLHEVCLVLPVPAEKLYEPVTQEACEPMYTLSQKIGKLGTAAILPTLKLKRSYAIAAQELPSQMT